MSIQAKTNINKAKHRFWLPSGHPQWIRTLFPKDDKQLYRIEQKKSKEFLQGTYSTWKYSTQQAYEAVKWDDSSQENLWNETNSIRSKKHDQDEPQKLVINTAKEGEKNRFLKSKRKFSSKW